MDTHSTKPSHAAVGYVGAVLVVGLAVFLGLGLNVVMPKVNVLLVLMLAVLLVSSRGGLGPSLLACLLVVSAFNYFFTEPIYSLKMAHRSDVATLVFFVIMAVFTANLAMRMQRERDGAERAARHAQNLYGLSRRLAAANDAVTVYQAVVEHLAATFPCAVLVRDAQGRVVAVAGPNALLERLQSGAVEPDITLTLEERRGAVTLFACMAEQEQAMGRAGLEEEHALARAVRDQAMVTLERIHLNDALEETRLGAETERLRNALLASLSHDLRTPLASVIGSLSTVRDCGPGIDSATRDDLLLTAEHEAERLDRYIQNLLDMTRIEHGTLRLQRDWTDPGDLVSAAVRRIEAANPGREVTIHLERSVPLIFVHGALIETVLVNLLDNAMRTRLATA